MSQIEALQAAFLPDHGRGIAQIPPPAGLSEPGERLTEAELLLAEFNAADSLPKFSTATERCPASVGARLLTLRRRFATARGDNFALRERIAHLDHELAVCRHQLAVLEWDRNAHQQYGQELQRCRATLERELHALKATFLRRVGRALNRFAGRILRSMTRLEKRWRRTA